MPGPAGLHARPRLPRRECTGVLPGAPSGGPAQHDQWVSAGMGVLSSARGTAGLIAQGCCNSNSVGSFGRTGAMPL